MQQKKGTEKSGAPINTPYDDVYRTMLNDCSSMIIPVINEAFGEHFSGDEEIIFSPNEHYINRQDGEEGVKSVMGGRVLDYEAKIIYTEGKENGEQNKAKETVFNLYAMGMEESQIAKAVNVSLAKVREWLGLTPAL